MIKSGSCTHQCETCESEDDLNDVRHSFIHLVPFTMEILLLYHFAPEHQPISSVCFCSFTLSLAKWEKLNCG